MDKTLKLHLFTLIYYSNYTLQNALVYFFLEIPIKRIAGVWLKPFLGLTYVDYQLWFLKYSPIFLFLIWPNLGTFWHFLDPSGLFLGLGSGSKTFLGPTYIDDQL